MVEDFFIVNIKKEYAQRYLEVSGLNQPIRGERERVRRKGKQRKEDKQSKRRTKGQKSMWPRWLDYIGIRS